MTKFFIRLLINGFALFAGVQLVPGIMVENSDPVTYLWLALIFAILNALLKPILKLLTCPFILLTLGLFMLLINTGLFYLTGWIGSQFDYGFTVSGFWSALLGALVVSIISMVGEMIFRDELKERPRRRE
jgi:putative membrane protein